MTKPDLVNQKSFDVEDYIDAYDEDFQDESSPKTAIKLNQDLTDIKLRDKPQENERSDSVRKAPTMMIETLVIGKPLKVLSLLTNVAVAIFFFLSTSGSNWILTTFLRVGLFEECAYSASGNGTNSCNRNPCFKGYVNIFLACCVTGLILSFLAIIVLAFGMKQTVIRHKLNMYNAVIILNALAVFLFIVSLIGYPIQFIREVSIINRMHKHGEVWGVGWSYVMGWLGVISAGVAMGLLHYDKSSDEVIYYERISRRNSCAMCA